MTRTPVTQVASPPPHLALTGEAPKPPGQPQEQTPVDDPHAEVEIKPVETQGQCGYGRRPKAFAPAVQAAD